MADYSWGIKEILDDYNRLNELSKNAKSKEMEEEFAEAYYYLSVVLNDERFADGSYCERKYTDAKVEYFIDTVYDYFDLYPFIDKFIKIEDKLRKRRDKNLSYRKTNDFSFDDVMELTNLFYSNIPDKTIYRCFEKVFKERKNVIKFNKDKHNSGMTYFVPILNKNYVTIKENIGDIEMLLTSVHEFAHCISTQYCSEKFLNRDMRFFEVDPLFFETLSQTFFAKELNNKDYLISQKQSLDVQYWYAKDIANDYEKYNYLIQNKILTTEDWNKKFPIKPFKEHTAKNFVYLVSYLLAIELYELYEKDPKKALYILKDFLNSKTMGEENEIFEKIYPCENIKSYHNKVFKRVKNYR